MTDERENPSGPNANPEDTIDNTLDSLLPVPDEQQHHAPEHGQVNGPIDEVLPPPGEPDLSADDASTREELEVDTTADGIDDFIPLHGDDSTEEPDREAESPQGDERDGEADTQQCLICGKPVAELRFCPNCGTEQVPTSRVVSKLAPLFMWSRPLAVRVTLSIGALLALLALLADSGALALIVTASTLPMVLMVRLADQLNGQHQRSWIQVGMMALVGAAVGLPIAWLGTRMVRRSWFEGGTLHFGATNFGGIGVEAVGNAPVLIWLTNGFLLPMVMVLTIGAAPAALRMALALSPRETTGMLLSAGTAVGYVIGSATVFYWPLHAEMAPVMSTSEWTLTILGMAALRPLVWVSFGAILGAVVWRYLRDASPGGIAVPAAMAISLPLGYSLASLAIAPFGLWGSVTIGVVFAAAGVYLQSHFLKSALRNDSVHPANHHSAPVQ